MKFNSDGTFSMEVNPDGQAPEMKALDNFLNGYLRSLSEHDRTQALELVNLFIDDGFTVKDMKDASAQEKMDVFMETLMDSRYSDDMSHLLAYVIKYEQTNPEFAAQIKNVLNEFGMESAVKWVEIAESVLNYEYTLEVDLGIFGTVSHTFTFDELFAIVTGTAGAIDGLTKFLEKIGWDVDPDWAIKLISDAIYDRFGIRLTAEQIREKLQSVESDIRLLETRTKTLSGGLRDAARSYETTENTNVSILST